MSEAGTFGKKKVLDTVGGVFIGNLLFNVLLAYITKVIAVYLCKCEEVKINLDREHSEHKTLQQSA
jgi:hypothetical protein